MASLLATPVSGWNAACSAIIIKANIDNGLVDQNGNPMPNFNNFTWGIDKSTCYSYCGKDKIYEVFNFNIFANAFTSWLLPWLALTAQLPFEAEGSLGNLMSLFMAVGSPALITYSLTITILNRIWVRRKFRSLQKKLVGVPDELHNGLCEQLRAAQYLLQESQQVPMRASQVDGWLSSLIALDKNHAWWTTVKKDLKNTRRGYTFSLFAQIAMAFLAYTLTIAVSLNSSPLGNDSAGNGVLLTAGGGIWIWMIPVILGWIMCGMQARACSITDALDDKTHPVFHRGIEGNNIPGDNQHGICSRSGLTPRPRFLESPTTLKSATITSTKPGNGFVEVTEVTNRTEGIDGREAVNETAKVDDFSEFGTATDSSDNEKGQMSDVNLLEVKEPTLDLIPVGEFPFDYEKLKLPSWLGFSNEGDEALEGPVFNYARLFTFREFSSTITNAFIAEIKSLKAGNNEEKNIFELATSCQLDKPLEAYIPWQKIDYEVWHHMLIAAGAAVVVQWGTTGPAIMIAFLTPTVGLGCRSGGYLIYGVAATISWALHICSFLLSHAVSLRYQDIYMGRRDFVPGKDNGDLESTSEATQILLKDQGLDPASLSAHRRTPLHSFLVALNVTTRISGKLIAFANACWIVVSAIFEYAGVYENCYCASDADVLGSRAWAVLFVSDQSFQIVARNYWIGGVIFSFGVCIATYIGFFLGCKRNDIDEYDD